MKKIVVSLLMILALTIVPVAHAAGVLDDACHSAQVQKKDAKSDNYTKKIADAGHHCGFSAVSFRSDAKSPELIATTKLQLVFSDDAYMASIVVGPLLKPPSIL